LIAPAARGFLLPLFDLQEYAKYILLLKVSRDAG
jgi:hypothetical protein